MDLYVEILNKIETAVIDDDVDSYKVSCALMKYVHKFLTYETAREYQQSAYAHFGDVNLICLACKSASVEVLEHLLSNENNLCRLPYFTKKSDIPPDFEDEEHHNAIYYAIRSNKIEILEILTQKWLNEYLRKNSEVLDDLLSNSMKDLMIRNVKICEDMRMYIKRKLVDFRFFNKTSQKKNTGGLNDTESLRNLTIFRIDSVIANITYLREKFWNFEPNEQFLLSSKYIAKNIHTLKSSITCREKLPWEEIEFCLIIFIRSCQACFQKYPLYHFVLNKDRLLTHLEKFSQILIKLKDKIIQVNKSKMGKLVIDKLDGRQNILDFKDLYDDFTQMRDLYSLEKIKSCIDLAMSANIIEKCDQLVIVRALQVIGECMKNTIDSHNLSEDTYKLLISSFPENTNKVLTKLRDSLSHKESLSVRSKIEKSGPKFFKSIQTDIAEMDSAIIDIIRIKKCMIIEKLFSKLRRCKDIDEVRLFLKQNHIFAISWQKELEEAQKLNVSSIKQFEKLFEELKREVKNELNSARKLICQIEDKFQNASVESASNISSSLDCLQSFFPMAVEEIRKISADFVSLTSVSEETEVESRNQGTVNMPKISEEHTVILAYIFTINELKITESLIKKINYYSNISYCPPFLSEMKKVKETLKIEDDDIKEFERLITDLKNYSDQKQNRVEEMFQIVHTLIENERSRLKNAQEKFSRTLLDLKTIFYFEDERFSNALKIPELDTQHLTLPPYSKEFASDIMTIFENIISELKRDNFTRGIPFMNALFNIRIFIDLNFGEIKWIKEFKEMLRSHKKESILKSPEKVPELNDQMEISVSQKLSLLQKVFNDYEAHKQFFENSQCSQKKLKLLSVIEMLSLDLMTILGSLPNRLTHNAYFLDSSYPVVNGKNLRNHLAHGNALVSIVLGVDCTDMLLNAEKMRAYDLLRPERQIGKKMKNDPHRLKTSLDEDLLAVDEQLKLFVALTEGNMGEVKESLSKGADIFGRNLCSQTALHFAAKGTCLETVKFVLKFNLDASAVDINLQNAFHIASLNGRLAIVEYFIQELNAPINTRDINGRTPLHLACINGHKDVVTRLLIHGAKTTSKDIFGKAALHYAVLQNHIEIVGNLFIKEEDAIKNKTFLGVSALHLASQMGHFDLVVTLLKKTNVNLRSDFHYVPLHYAARGGHADIVKHLIEKGAEVNAKCLNGATPIQLAVGKDHYEVVEILLQHGAKINAAASNSCTPTSFDKKEEFLPISKLSLGKDTAIYGIQNYFCIPLCLAAFYGYHGLVEMLLHKSETGSKIMALHLAAYKGHLTVVELLINNGINNYSVNNGYTELHLAACEGHTDVVNFLISKGYNVNEKIGTIVSAENEILDSFLIDVSSSFGVNSFSQFSGKTALHLSVRMGHKDTVRSLLKCEADIYIKDDTDITPLQMMILEGMTDILVEEKVPVNLADLDDFSPLKTAAGVGDLLFVKYCIHKGCGINLRSKSSDISALDLAVLNGHVEVVSYLIDCGADVNAARHDGTTALEIAVTKNRKNIVNILINKNAEISVEKERRYLLSAISSGHEDIVEYFLVRNPSNGAPRPESQEYPLHTAVLIGHLNIVKMLLELGVMIGINDKNKYSLTPLQIASENGHCEIARLLLLNGAEPNILSDNNLQPLHQAVLNDDFEMMEILIKAGANTFQRDAEGSSAIELAIKCKNLDIMEALLEHSKPDINLKGHDNRTLLHHAAAAGSLQAVKSLEDKGACVNCRDSTGAKPIHIAAEEGHENIVEYFLREGLDIDDRDLGNFCSLLHYAAAGNQSGVCKFLLKSGLHVNIIDADGDTPLHVAAQMYKVGVLHTLLHYGAHYDIQNERNDRPIDVAMFASLPEHIPNVASLTFISSLWTAVQKNDPSKVEALLDEGLKFSEFGFVNIKNAKNTSLLHYSVWKGYEEIVALLLKYKADPNVRISKGGTPLHYAAKFSHPRIVNMLLYNGAMFDAECDSKKTPIDYAKNQDIIKILGFLKKMFSKIENGDNSILNCLRSLGDDTAKIAIRAKNSCYKTLTAYAVIKEHPELQSLKSIFQPDFTYLCQRAAKLNMEAHFEESLQQYKIILGKRIDIFGEEDPGVLDIQEVICEILINQKKYDEAQSLIEKIYKIRKEILGDSHKDSLKTLRLIASVLELKGRKKEALNMYENILKKQKDVLGSDNIETLRSQIRIVQLMRKKETESNNLAKALSLCLEILEKLNKIRYSEELILQFKLQIAQELRKLGKRCEALDIFKEIFEIQKQKFGLYHSQTSDTLFQKAVTLFSMGEEEDSLEAFRQTRDIRNHVLGPNNEKTLHSRYWEANVLFSQRMFHEAFEIYKADLNARISILGENDPKILDTIKKINFILSRVIM
ncbi:unnamed protein product [Larinioides sclopetarius]|uniref:Uncharacterized protein n=1 Tax=Larinioides sclopetarius TaxID=280406 RepID=A0AAV1Z126_9ARAC